MKLYPLKFKSIYKQRIWGGQKLRGFFGKDLPAGEKIGESWELADLSGGKSIISNGDFAGKTLHEVVKNYPKEITGGKNFVLPFPLLIKFLDANDILSVQVHPDPETCTRTGKGDPKTECWYIIDAAKDAVIYKGLKPGTTKDNFTKAIETGDVAELLNKVHVETGQCHFLPAGTAHAIGPGLLIAEIQTPSDTTYRVFDWNRVDNTGKPRDLHIEEALESIHFDSSKDNLSVSTQGRLVDSEYFKIDKHIEYKNSEIRILPGDMKVLVMLSGSGKFSKADKISTGFKAGDCLLVPAAYQGKMIFADDTEYLTVL